MFKKLAYGMIVTAALGGATLSSSQAAEQSCLPIGGVAIADFFSEGEGKTT